MSRLWLKSWLETLYRWLCAFGIDPLLTGLSIRGLLRTLRDYRRFLTAARRSSANDIRLYFNYPCLTDRFNVSGSSRGHYFHQDLLVARRIYELRPERHVDVGSRIDGLVAHLAVFREVEVFDIRPLPGRIPNVALRQVDMSKEPTGFTGYADSVSCLHALEHFGLGRYGDSIDPEGHIKGFHALASLLRPGGRLYLSVPIGPERIEFNAHRVLSIATILNCAATIGLRLDRFAYVDDHGDLHDVETIDEARIADNYGCEYGCGIFEFVLAADVCNSRYSGIRASVA